MIERQESTRGTTQTDNLRGKLTSSRDNTSDKSQSSNFQTLSQNKKKPTINSYNLEGRTLLASYSNV